MTSNTNSTTISATTHASVPVVSARVTVTSCCKSESQWSAPSSVRVQFVKFTYTPFILTRSSRAVRGSWRALSIWRLPPAVKVRLIEEHPLLLRLSPQELHGR